MNEPKVIEVVAGLIFQHGRVLACQRRAEGPFPLKWEFPGGKIEAGEKPNAALERELLEELNIAADGARPVFTHRHSYPGFSTVKLSFFSVPSYHGQILNRVFAKIRWVNPDELVELDFLDGDLPVIAWLTKGDGAALYHSPTSSPFI